MRAGSRPYCPTNLGVCKSMMATQVFWHLHDRLASFVPSKAVAWWLNQQNYIRVLSIALSAESAIRTLRNGVSVEDPVGDLFAVAVSTSEFSRTYASVCARLRDNLCIDTPTVVTSSCPGWYCQVFVRKDLCIIVISCTLWSSYNFDGGRTVLMNLATEWVSSTYSWRTIHRH